MICDFNCFECRFSDCILDFDSGSFSDLEVLTSQQIDDILFKKDFQFIDVPDYRLYPFIPSSEIPYNPNWKSQARWREYYRSRARGNRSEKVRATSRLYYQNHREKCSAYRRAYLEEHREENRVRCRENYVLNREKRLAYQREYYARHKKGNQGGAT